MKPSRLDLNLCAWRGGLIGLFTWFALVDLFKGQWVLAGLHAVIAGANFVLLHRDLERVGAK